MGKDGMKGGGVEPLEIPWRELVSVVDDGRVT